LTPETETRAHDTARSRRWANVDIRSDEEKDEEKNLVEYVERRASFLRREYGLEDNLARALGWRELGFSTSGVADMMDISEGTARKYLDELREKIGEENVDRVARPVGDRDVDEPLTGVATTKGREAA
jgi:DNA-directed RNA polymerase specialized sigma24 family protein